MFLLYLYSLKGIKESTEITTTRKKSFCRDYGLRLYWRLDLCVWGPQSGLGDRSVQAIFGYSRAWPILSRLGRLPRALCLCKSNNNRILYRLYAYFMYTQPMPSILPLIVSHYHRYCAYVRAYINLRGHPSTSEYARVRSQYCSDKIQYQKQARKAW